MQEMTKPSINQRNQTREIASGQDGPSTRTNAPNSQYVNTSRSSNDANSPMSGDVSNSPQNDYDTLRGV